MINIQQEVINGNINPYELLDLWNEKPLDQSDIESLGWESDQYVPERNICLNFKKPNDWYLNYWFGQTPYIEISRDGYDTGCALNVKNKSQLKFIMTCLGILE